MERAPSHKITEGIQVEIQSHECLGPIWGGVTVVRVGVVRQKVNWEKK